MYTFRLRGRQRPADEPVAARVAAPRQRDRFDHVVSRPPPGTSKSNEIEHRRFAFITMNWRDQLLVSQQVLVQLIGAKATDQEMQAINITRDEFHGERNYSISVNE